MEFREMMWDLFISTGNLDAYLAYRACVCPEPHPGGPMARVGIAHYSEEASACAGGVPSGGE